MRRSIAQDWAWEAAQKQVQLTEQMIPKEYQQHVKVFSEMESLRFPPKQEEDITIPLKANAPDVINCKVCPLTREERGLLEKFLAKELELGRIKEGPSPYMSPVYFINKKDSEEKRIIMDYREVNKWTVRDNNPLPNIREALKNLRNKTLFLKFDIRWGYNNIQITKKDQYKAAFKTKNGTFCYAPGLILCAMRLSVLIFCYIRLASCLCVPPDRLTAHTGHSRYLDT